MKKIKLTPTTLFDHDKLEVLTLDKATATKVITELAEGLSGTGIGTLVLRSGDRLFVFKIETSQEEHAT